MLKNKELSVIKESVPSGEYEIRHKHLNSRQLFYILKGEAEIEIEGKTFVLKKDESIEIPPLHYHQLLNKNSTALEFLVISQPPSHEDRITE